VQIGYVLLSSIMPLSKRYGILMRKNNPYHETKKESHLRAGHGVAGCGHADGTRYFLGKALNTGVPQPHIIHYKSNILVQRI